MAQERTLPDGTPLPHTAYFDNGSVHDWTGIKCTKCFGDEMLPDNCTACGGTGDAHGPVWRWEE